MIKYSQPGTKGSDTLIDKQPLSATAVPRDDDGGIDDNDGSNNN